jgi:hypothetical protein
MAKITIVLPEDEVQALAQLLKRLTYDGLRQAFDPYLALSRWSPGG